MNAASITVTRPALRYHGGKWRLAPWIISHFPHHHTYVEPYGGAASVLLRKPRAIGEVYNDLADAVVTVFRVLRDPHKAAELRRRAYLTPYSRVDFEDALMDAEDDTDIDLAHKTIVRSWMGFGSDSTTRLHATGFRNNSTRRGTTPAQDWAGWPSCVEQFIERLRAVVIEHRDALEVMRQHDDPETLHYVDPPYVPRTRAALLSKRASIYAHEMNDTDHEAMAKTLRELRGMVVLSGYDNDLYRDWFGDWETRAITTLADGALRRTETLWLNKACASRQSQSRLF